MLPEGLMKVTRLHNPNIIQWKVNTIKLYPPYSTCMLTEGLIKNSSVKSEQHNFMESKNHNNFLTPVNNPNTLLGIEKQ